MKKSLLLSAALSLFLVPIGCGGDGKSGGDASVVAGDVEVTAEMLDLDAAVGLVKSGKVKDAAALEKRINDPKSNLAKVDIDGDGVIDFIQVVESRDGDEVNYELRAVPSTKMKAEAAVTIASIAVVADRSASTIKVRATYTDVVVKHDAHVFEYSLDATWDGDVVVVVGAPFFGWAYSEHEIYVGVYVHEEWIVVPGIVTHQGKVKKHKFKKRHKGKRHKGKRHKGKRHKGKRHKGKRH